MTKVDALDQLAAFCGILPSFVDLSGTEHRTSTETKIALLRAKGIDIESPAAAADTLETQRSLAVRRLAPDEVIVSSAGPAMVGVAAPCEWVLEFESGGSESIEGRAEHQVGYLADYGVSLPPLPLGVHTLHLRDANGVEAMSVVAAPDRAPTVVDVAGRPRIWGVNAALYGLHSAATQGIGSFDDLRKAAEVLAAHGASFLGINPIHAMGWAEDVAISPYSPSHRGFFNTSHISPGDLHGLAPTAVAGGPLLPSTIDYTAHRKQQHAALDHGFLAFEARLDPAAATEFEAFCQKGGEPLERFALFETVSELHGPDWRCWPEPFRNPSSSAVRKLGATKADRVRFHSWLQWQADAQICAAQSGAQQLGMSPGLYLDLAVGSRRGGAETWCEQGNFAAGVSLGAPPDDLSPGGQNWNLAAFDPSLLKQTQYRSFRSIVAHTMRHAGILRIDHVLGLNRSFWVPDDGSPGAYVRQPLDALLAVIAIEAVRTGTVIVGEDLGLVPEGFRERLQARGLYSYSVLQYEKDENGSFLEPSRLRPDSLTCFGTHDTPTLHGYFQQRDVDWWASLNWIDAETEATLRRQREAEVDGLLALGPQDELPESSFEKLSESVHGALAESPVAMASVQLDDVFGGIQAQNLPGTVTEHPNWQRRVPQPIEHFESQPELSRIGLQMRKAGRSTEKSQMEGNAK